MLGGRAARAGCRGVRPKVNKRAPPSLAMRCVHNAPALRVPACAHTHGSVCALCVRAQSVDEAAKLRSALARMEGRADELRSQLEAAKAQMESMVGWWCEGGVRAPRGGALRGDGQGPGGERGGRGVGPLNSIVYRR